MDFIPKNKDVENQMLHEIGLSSMTDLFTDIPESIRIKELKLAKGLSESEVKNHVENLANKNKSYKSSFLGAGSYAHYVPSMVNHLLLRGEFFTAYTPYQAEMAQGNLQAIFEFQTMMAELTGMDVSNASVYDGAQAFTEAGMMCINKTRREEIVVSKAVHPDYRQTLKTYLDAKGKKLVEVDVAENGLTDMSSLKEAISENTAGVLIQSPNFLGSIEKVEEIAKIAHDHNALLAVTMSDITCLGIMKPPKDADIVTAEGQPFGSAKSFGGPYVGVMATKKELMRFIPGRLVGETFDTKGRKGYTLTLQAREQHIRRERASCNICTNQALVALASSMHIAALGKKGVRDLAFSNLQKAHYTYDKLKEVGVNIKFDNYFYNEFVVEIKNFDKVKNELEKRNIEPGLSLERFFPDLKNCMLICTTEMNKKKDIDEFVSVLGGAL